MFSSKVECIFVSFFETALSLLNPFSGKMFTCVLSPKTSASENRFLIFLGEPPGQQRAEGCCGCPRPSLRAALIRNGRSKTFTEDFFTGPFFCLRHTARAHVGASAGGGIRRGEGGREGETYGGGRSTTTT